MFKNIIHTDIYIVIKCDIFEHSVTKSYFFILNKKGNKNKFCKKKFISIYYFTGIINWRSTCYIIWETKGKLIIYFNAEIYYITISDIF